MKKFVAGAVFGIVVATIGLTGLLTIFDKGVNLVKTQAEELAK
jgi:hypothetical protein